MEELILEEATKGTYAAVKFSKDTIDRLHQFVVENDIPNPLAAVKYHTTVIYSRKHCPKMKGKGKLNQPWIGKPTQFDVFTTRPKKDTEEPSRCLVLRFECAELEGRHEQLMDDHKATYDFENYHPHITLSYNIGSMKIKKLQELIDEIGEIEIISEYVEDLDLDWTSNN